MFAAAMNASVAGNAGGARERDALKLQKQGPFQA
jgi:hypothetical protein